MKKQYLIVFALMCFLGLTRINAQDTFEKRWNVGGAYSAGFAKKGIGFLAGLEVDFTRQVKKTPWRWGIMAGIMNPGTAAYWSDDDSEEDEFQYYNYTYLMGFADYAFNSITGVVFYARGGLAPCLQSDIYNHHTDSKISGLVQLGVGAEINGIFRLGLTGFVGLNGDYGGSVSLGLYFGKK